MPSKESVRHIFCARMMASHSIAIERLAHEMEELSNYEWKRVYTRAERQAIARTILRFRCGGITGDCGTLNWSRTSDADPIYWLE